MKRSFLIDVAGHMIKRKWITVMKKYNICKDMYFEVSYCEKEYSA